nr:MAG TPA: hypothetical protein [Caudoviricetes sp.]
MLKLIFHLSSWQGVYQTGAVFYYDKLFSLKQFS